MPHVVPVFLSDGTGISAEAMSNALLIQVPDLRSGSVTTTRSGMARPESPSATGL
jgi:hypothetical protein